MSPQKVIFSIFYNKFSLALILSFSFLCGSALLQNNTFWLSKSLIENVTNIFFKWHTQIYWFSGMLYSFACDPLRFHPAKETGCRSFRERQLRQSLCLHHRRKLIWTRCMGWVAREAWVDMKIRILKGDHIWLLIRTGRLVTRGKMAGTEISMGKSGCDGISCLGCKRKHHKRQQR